MKIHKRLPIVKGWLEASLPPNAMERLWSYIDESYVTNINHKPNLIGHVDRSVLLSDTDDWFYNNILTDFLDEYAEQFFNLGNNSGITGQHKYTLDSLWVNFQKQGEFNPIHTHGGVYSFVIWMKIPTDYREQHKLFGETNGSHASDFGFVNGEDVTYYQLDSKMEGTILFFPSKMQHVVYPFYNCDEKRISISGNISLETDK